MITIFSTSSPLVFFPKRWANSVARWILGLHSPTGTLSIANTNDPQPGTGAAIDVNITETARRIESALRSSFVSRREPSGVDNISLQLNSQGQIRINEEWLDNFVRARVQTSAQVTN